MSGSLHVVAATSDDGGPVQQYEAEEAEQLGWRDRYDDQMKDTRRPERG
jgi:hypothetical protein